MPFSRAGKQAFRKRILYTAPFHPYLNRAGWLALLCLGLNACSPATIPTGLPNSLAPKGPGAATIASDWWLMFGLGTAVFLVVIGLFAYAVYTRRRRDALDEVLLDAPEGHSWIWWGGIILPIIILTITLIFSLRALAALASPAVQPVTTIEVTGYRWWWEVRYPEEEFTTANELYLPVGQPVEIRLTSQDVIHSFWVPELHGKLDLNPGSTNSMLVQADEPGMYRGFCAEFCGVQHARMQFVVVAVPEEEYRAWVQAQQQPAPEPVDEAIRTGQQVFLGSSCVYCHTVRGTNASGKVGPDLTHLASRQTIGAGILPNNRGALAGWIVDPQHLKPGNLMPATRLESGELQAMLDYLGTLR